jgi:hypothetical protein
MTEPMFEIGTEGVDTDRIVREIRETVARKIDDGLYSDALIARAERTNLENFKDDEAFLEFYLQHLREVVFVDIGDFEIHERRKTFPGMFTALKKSIWKMLKFYTYRLWSQQNQVNGLLLSASEAIDNKYKERIRQLEERVDRLEKK